MAARALSAVGLVTLLALTVPSLAFGGDLRLTFQNGRVTLVAHDVPLREILAEWERVGGTRVVNRDAAPAAPVTLDLSDVPEARALAILLQQAAGYFASERTTLAEASSRFTRIVIMPGAERLAAGQQMPTGPQAYGAAAGNGLERPQFQQHIMPDGRVVSFIQYPARRVETPIVEEEENLQAPPAEVPVSVAVPLPPGMVPARAVANPSQDSAPGGQPSEKPAQLPTQAAPTVRVTAAVPGTFIPGPKPEPPPYTPQGPPPPPPIRPPDI